MVTENPVQIDVVIIGGGPAGISALLWCSELGLSSLLLEKGSELGGQLLWTFNPIENYLGLKATDGRDLRDRFLRHIEEERNQILTGTIISNVDLAEKIVALADGRSFAARSIVISTGVRRRKLNVQGEKDFRSRGILSSGVRAIDEVKGKNVLIVGGGDAALENAVILSEKASKVYLVHRRREFTARKEFIEHLGSPSIKVFVEHALEEIKGVDRVEAVSLRDLRSGSRCHIAVDHVLIRIGVVPNTELFRGQIDLDDSGYIKVDAIGSTSSEGVYAAGDVASPKILTISNAVGQGTAVAKGIYNRKC